MLALLFPCGPGLYPAPVGLGPFGHIWNHLFHLLWWGRKRGFPKSLWMWWGTLSTPLLWSGGTGMQWLVMALPWMPKESRVAHSATILCGVCEVLKKVHQHCCPPGWLLGWWGVSLEMPASVLRSGKSLHLLTSVCPLLERCLNLQGVYCLLITFRLKKVFWPTAATRRFSMFSFLQEQTFSVKLLMRVVPQCSCITAVVMWWWGCSNRKNFLAFEWMINVVWQGIAKSCFIHVFEDGSWWRLWE